MDVAKSNRSCKCSHGLTPRDGNPECAANGATARKLFPSDAIGKRRRLDNPGSPAGRPAAAWHLRLAETTIDLPHVKIEDVRCPAAIGRLPSFYIFHSFLHYFYS